MDLNKIRALPVVAGAGLLAAAGSAQAQLDVTSVTDAFGDATTAVGAIAAVMLGVVGAGIAIRWTLGFLLK